jgi:glycosyltransferase involved in cell wall biosynthesis
MNAGHTVDVFQPIVERVDLRGRARAAVDAVWARHSTKEVHRRILRLRPDVIHVHNLFPALSPAVLRIPNEPIAVVATLHNYRLLCLPGTFLRDGRVCEDCLGRRPWPGIVHACYRGSLLGSGAIAGSLMLHDRIGSYERVDLHLAISDFVRSKHIEAGLPADKIIVKPHFVAPARQRQGPGEYFVYLGRLSREKGVETLLRAWRTVPANLVIVGDGPERQVLRGMAPEGVEFRDAIDPEEVPELMERARAVMVPSVSHEGAGRVVLEAYASGVPVLASRAGGLPEVVEDGKTGLLLPPGDPQRWSNAAKILLDDAVSTRMGRAGRLLWRRRYTPQHGLSNLESAYRSALRRAGSAGAPVRREPRSLPSREHDEG